MNVFISGGCKNGKSAWAQRTAKDMAEKSGRRLYYVATMIAVDDEDRARIKRHLKNREGMGFTTLEQGRDICGALSGEVDRKGVFLVDSVTALLSNEMFPPGGAYDFTAGKRLEKELAAFAGQTGDAVFISDYIYSEGRILDEYTERYRRALAGIDRGLASLCDEVVEISFGMVCSYGRKK